MGRETDKDAQNHTGSHVLSCVLPRVHHHGGKVYLHRAMTPRAPLNQAVEDTLADKNCSSLPVEKHVRRKLTFVLQRVAGSYFHGSTYGLSRTVNHLIVRESDIKFLKLSHGSAPLRNSAALRL